MSEHASRKEDHLDLCATDQVAFQGKSTLFEQVQFLHEALPELAVSDIDLRTTLLGKPLRAPLVIAAMTGGMGRAERVNRDLAEVAEARGLGFGFGSMRPLLQEGVQLGYKVRDVAPTALVLGNIGIVQAREASTQALMDMVGIAGCDALCVHLNPAMELIQPEGDQDFRGGLETLARLHEELSVPIVAKETGCGLSRRTAQQIAAIGIGTVDVSGAGGTSWVGVETLRARARTRTLGELFWDWGIPTAASVAQLEGLGLDVIATGGVKHGLDAARALALGARAAGMARPFLMAWNEGGRTRALQTADQIVEELRLACLLTGSRTPAALGQVPLVLGPELLRWLPRVSPIRARLLDA
ncbi:MAG: type 2 isopentenyl-diphosphate Delta-isomerase [Deltaproteobacteria bacterium]|nr:MAG: type 2 isopentenyl-diphosphate Delta-isomerase [Deltaproteobacteria bacterium]